MEETCASFTGCFLGKELTEKENVYAIIQESRWRTPLVYIYYVSIYFCIHLAFYMYYNFIHYSSVFLNQGCLASVVGLVGIVNVRRVQNGQLKVQLASDVQKSGLLSIPSMHRRASDNTEFSDPKCL